MNRIFALIILLLPFCSNAQLPLGSFAYGSGYEGQLFTFKKENRFEYYFFSCYGGSRGSGTYTFKDSVLKLYFEKSKEQAEYAAQIKFTPTNNDSSYISFMFFDPEDKNSIIDEGIIIKVFRLPMNQLIFGTGTKSKITKITVFNNDLPVEISTGAVTRSEVKFKIENKGDYEVLCPVKYDFIRQLSNNDTMEFFVEKFNKNEILIAENKTLLAKLHTKNKARLFFRKRK